MKSTASRKKQDATPLSRKKMNKQEMRIAEIFGAGEIPEVNNKTLKSYLTYLKGNLELPCRVTGIEDFQWEEFYILGPGSKKEHEKLRQTQPSYLDTFELLGLEKEFDEFSGLFVTVNRITDNKTFTLPLADLKAKRKDSNNHRLLNDYSVWFVNWQ